MLSGLGKPVVLKHRMPSKAMVSAAPVQNVQAVAELIDAAQALLAARKMSETVALLRPLVPAALSADLCQIVGLLHLCAGASDPALMWFGHILAICPSDAGAHHGRAMALHQLGRAEEALAAYDAALRHGASEASFFYDRGNLLRSLGRRDEAIASYDEALRRRPAYPEALLAGAEILAESGCDDDALRFYDEAIRLDPMPIAALLGRGLLLQRRGRLEAAIATFERALALRPKDADLLCNKGVALYHLGKLTEALCAYDAALHVRPRFPEALSNRGNVLMLLGRHEEALAGYDAALAIRPDYVEGLCNRALALQEVLRLDEAAADFEKALQPGPSFPHVRKNQAMLRLLRGDFERGLEGYESRWSHGGTLKSQSRLDLLEWPGPAAGFGRLLVFDEQGLGDAIQFSRYLPLVASHGADVTFVCRASLQRLFRGLAAQIDSVDAVPPKRGFDHQIALASFPHAFATRPATIYAPSPYLRAEPERIAHWAARLGGQGLRVGLCWHGNAENKPHLARSIPLAAFAPLSALDGVRLISLQRCDGLDELADRPMKLEILGEDIDAEGDAFVDTAAIMMSLDLIVSCDTSVAHLAGALGRPVWTLLKRSPDWRWLLGRTDSPWYPTMRLFRQDVQGDWDAVIADVAAALKGFAKF